MASHPEFAPRGMFSGFASQGMETQPLPPALPADPHRHPISRCQRQGRGYAEAPKAKTKKEGYIYAFPIQTVPSFPCFPSSSHATGAVLDYVSSFSTRMLSIMTSRPMVTMMSRVKLNQPMTMALVPTPDSTLPLARSWAMMEAATDAVCCHSTDTSTKMDAMNMMPSATWLTGRDVIGFTSRSDPSLSSSSCQPGKVARRRRQMKAKMMAMILSGYMLATLFLRGGSWGREWL